MKTFYSIILVLMMAGRSVSADGIKGMVSKAEPPAISPPRDESELLAHAPTVINARLLQGPTKMPPNGASVSSIKINGRPVPVNGVEPVSAPGVVDCSRYGGQLAANGVPGGKGGKGGKGKRGRRNQRALQGVPVECLRQPGFNAASLTGKGGKGGKGGGKRVGVSGGRFSGNGRVSNNEGGEGGENEVGTMNMKGAKSAPQSQGGHQGDDISGVESLLLPSSSAVYSMATATIAAAGVALVAIL